MPEIIEDGITRRTDAKRMDIIDFLRKQEIENKNKYSLPVQIWDYPEPLVELLKTFVEIWNLPEGSIPSGKNKLGKNKGSYSNWVLQLESLKKLFSSDERMKLAMRYAYEKYQKSEKKDVIYQPASIQPLLVDAISDLRRQEKKTLLEKPNEVIVASRENIKNTIKDLKNILESEDE